MHFRNSREALCQTSSTRRNHLVSIALISVIPTFEHLTGIYRSMFSGSEHAWQ